MTKKREKVIRGQSKKIDSKVTASYNPELAPKISALRAAGVALKHIADTFNLTQSALTELYAKELITAKTNTIMRCMEVYNAGLECEDARVRLQCADTLYRMQIRSLGEAAFSLQPGSATDEIYQVMGALGERKINTFESRAFCELIQAKVTASKEDTRVGGVTINVDNESVSELNRLMVDQIEQAKD